jgi:uncharacterized membrane protein
MRQMIIQYIIVLVIFLAIDAVWLTNAGRLFYVPEIGPLLRDSPLLPAACLFYCVYSFGLLWFVVEPSVASVTLPRVFMTGAFFGLVAYATYDLTNYSTLKGFTLRIAAIDMAWGAVLSGSVSCVSVWLLRLLKI